MKPYSLQWAINFLNKSVGCAISIFEIILLQNFNFKTANVKRYQRFFNLKPKGVQKKISLYTMGGLFCWFAVLLILLLCCIGLEFFKKTGQHFD